MWQLVVGLVPEPGPGPSPNSRLVYSDSRSKYSQTLFFGLINLEHGHVPELEPELGLGPGPGLAGWAMLGCVWGWAVPEPVPGPGPKLGLGPEPGPVLGLAGWQAGWAGLCWLGCAGLCFVGLGLSLCLGLGPWA